MFLFTFTTILLLLGLFTSKLGIWLHKTFNQLTEQEQILLEERNTLKKEQSTLSIGDDFVKHSKLQRKIIKIEEDLNSRREKSDESKAVLNFTLKKGPQVLHTALIVLNIIWNRYTPIFLVDEKFNLFPFGFLIAFPIMGVPNAVSVQFWTVCVHAGFQLIKSRLK